jgi:hypothetical protein
MGRVVIGMDPHWRSATIEALDERERVLATGRFGTDREGYRDLLAAGRRCRTGCGRSRAAKKLAGIWRSGWSPTANPSWTCLPSYRRGRECSPPGRGARPTLRTAHSVAVVALHTHGLRQVAVDATVALRLLVDRRDELGAARTLTVNRLHRLLMELVPGGAKKSLSAPRPTPCLPRCGPGTSWARLGGSSRLSWSASSRASTRRSRRRTSRAAPRYRGEGRSRRCRRGACRRAGGRGRRAGPVRWPRASRRDRGGWPGRARRVDDHG